MISISQGKKGDFRNASVSVAFFCLTVRICYTIRTPMDKIINKEEFESFKDTLEKLWPLAKGSMSEVRKPCIRLGCAACAKGEKHRAFIFAYRDGKRRRCMHVPLELVPVMRQAIDNCRRLEKRLHQQGPELILNFRKKRKQKSK